MTTNESIGGVMRGNQALLRLVVSLAVLVGVYVGMATFVSGQVAANATVDGIAIGGMSPGQATVTLERVLATKVSRPVQLKAQSRTVKIDPAAAGLEIDLEATLSDLSGFTLNPVRLWAHLAGTQSQDLKLRVDRAKLTAAVTKAAGGFDSRVKEGSITFADGKATVVGSVAGREVMVRQTTDAVASAWPHQQVVRAIIKVTRPKLPADEVRRAAREFAVPAMSAPVKAVLGRDTISLKPRQYAPALLMTPDASGTLRPHVDAAKLAAAIRAADPRITDTPVDATVVMVAGKPSVVPAVVGRRINVPAVSAPFLAALTSSNRTVKIRTVSVPPKVTTAMAQSWRVRGEMSTFTTQFPVNPPRTNNIKIAIATLNDTVVPPGGQFSLNETLGERTGAKGYQQAPVIYAGRLVSDYGGGVSQVSTTTYNAAFFAGVRVDQHTPHSFFIARYPEGREATVSWPDVDQKWTNDTGEMIVIKARVSGSDVTVSLLGTKKWDIEAVRGRRRNVVKPKSIVDARAGCVPQTPTLGFDVTVAQIFRKNGATVKILKTNTHYIPEDKVVCTHPTAP